MSQTLAELLAEHMPSNHVNSKEFWVGCGCGANIPIGPEFCQGPYDWPMDMDEEDRVHHVHVAEVVTAWFRERLLSDEVVRIATWAANTSRDYPIARMSEDRTRNALTAALDRIGERKRYDTNRVAK